MSKFIIRAAESSTFVGRIDDRPPPCGLEDISKCPSYNDGLPCAHPTCRKGTDDREIEVDGVAYRRVKSEDGHWVWKNRD